MENMIVDHQMDIEIESVSYNSLTIRSRDKYLLIDVGGHIASITNKAELDKLIEFLTYHRTNNL